MRFQNDLQAIARMIQCLRPWVARLEAEGIAEPSAILTTLNARGIPTPHGGRWHIRMIRSSLSRMDAFGDPSRPNAGTRRSEDQRRALP